LEVVERVGFFAALDLGECGGFFNKKMATVSGKFGGGRILG
jgi:hypothetical protein